MKNHILVIDDDTSLLLYLERLLGKEGFLVTTCNDPQDGIRKIQEKKYDLILCDQALGDMEGIQLLTCARAYYPDVPFIIITGCATYPKAVESLKKGATNYIEKPINPHELIQLLQRTLEEAACRIPKEDIPLLQTEISKTMVGNSEKIQKLFYVIAQIAKTSATVLVQGESGTGKELIARAIHQFSLRSEQPFVAINCGYLSDNLLENELFGHVQGAFTGATKHKRGLLEEAHGGTLFLDEIGDMPLLVQTKLLRVLQEKEFKPLGSNETVRVDVRVIAATNVNLRDAVAQKKFREDLYYRLAVIPIMVPPLRERAGDIPLLAVYFAKKYGKENDKNIEYITPEAMARLTSYSWPGNVRELENTIARAVALATTNSITLDLLIPKSTAEKTLASPLLEETSLREIIRRDTKSAIEGALQLSKGNYSQAARILGISRASLYHKMKKYALVKSSNNGSTTIS